MWQPIETAPKDGRNILAYHVGYDGIHNYIAEAWWDDNEWLFAEDCSAALPNDPTHWMPIPTPPEFISA